MRLIDMTDEQLVALIEDTVRKVMRSNTTAQEEETDGYLYGYEQMAHYLNISLSQICRMKPVINQKVERFSRKKNRILKSDLKECAKQWHYMQY